MYMYSMNFYDNFKYSFPFYLFLFLARFDRNVSFRTFDCDLALKIVRES